MTTRRYSEDDSATYNDQLQRLDDLYNTTGNAIELVASGTLASNTNEIRMSLGDITWGFLMLRATTIMTAGGSSYDLTLKANNDLSVALYDACIVTGTSAGGFTGSSLTDDVYGGFVNDTNPAMIEMMIWPHSLGFAVIGGSSTLNAGVLTTSRWGGFYSGGTRATSLQLRTQGSPAPQFAAGTVYRLEGARA